MAISKRLAAILDSYFGKTMGHEVEHSPSPFINMAMGIPDGETPEGIIEHFSEVIRIPGGQKYGTFHGKESSKEAIANFYQRQYSVASGKEGEVCILYDTKNGLIALPTCAVNLGENVSLPDPEYIDYLIGVMLADANPVPLNLDSPDYLPNWDNVDKRILDSTTLAYLTHPNDPVGSAATKEVFDEVIERFKGTEIKTAHDFAYNVFNFNVRSPSTSVLEHGEDTAIEISSLSKGYSMPGFKVGLAVGDKNMIQTLKKYQTHTGVGMFGTLQNVAIYALNHHDGSSEERNETFKRHWDKFETKLSEAHLPFVHSKGGIHSWLHVPPDYDSETFEQHLLKERSILVAPGIPLGENEEHYMCTLFALDDEWLEEAASRLVDLADMYKAKYS